MNPLVSIIMPAYNSEQYIMQAIDSVINQTYTNWELLIVDDCSKDRTKKIIMEASFIDSRIKPIFRENNGGKPSIAKNSAFPFIHGKYIAFLDSDDLWMKEKLSVQVAMMNANPDMALTYTGGYFINAQGNIIKSFLPKYSQAFNLKNMLRRYEVNNQSVMISKIALESTLQNFNESILIGEDYNLFMHIIAKYPTTSIKQHLVKYRIHQASITKNKRQITDGVLLTLKELQALYNIKSKFPIYYFLTYVKAIRFKYFPMHVS